MIKVCIIKKEVSLFNNIAAVLLHNKYEVSSATIKFSEAIQLIESELPDIILLQIGDNACAITENIAWLIKNKYNIPLIILSEFSYLDIKEKADLLDPCYVLSNSFTEQLLIHAVEEAVKKTMPLEVSIAVDPNKKNDFLFIKEFKNYIRIKLDSILYLESDHVYVIVHTITKNYKIRSTMKQVLESLFTINFISIGRTYIVNTDFIESINKDCIIINGIKLPIQKSSKKILLQNLNLK